MAKSRNKSSVSRTSQGTEVIYIYGLFDETGIRYIGQATDVPKRLRDHLRDKRRNHKGNWIRRLLAEGKEPGIRVLEEATASNFEDRERAWVARGLELGWDLTNATGGGIGTRGLKHGEETRRKMAEAKVGNAWNKGCARVISEEQRRQISETLTGRTLSAEHRRKISQGGMGRVQSEETRKKLSDIHLGTVMSVEARQKMSEARKGKAPWNKGRKCEPPSEETRKKLSEAMREYRRKKKAGLL